MALQLGLLEGLDPNSLCTVELAALLHDIRDWKYSKGKAVHNWA
jgi:HD superfamily phosphodiesterase